MNDVDKDVEEARNLEHAFASEYCQDTESDSCIREVVAMESDIIPKREDITTKIAAMAKAMEARKAVQSCASWQH